MNLELIESVVNLIDLGAIKNEDISKNLKSAIEQTKKSVHKNDIEKIYFDFCESSGTLRDFTRAMYKFNGWNFD